MARRCAGRVGRLLGGSLAGWSGPGSGYLFTDDQEAVGVGEGRGSVERGGAVGPEEDALMEERSGQPRRRADAIVPVNRCSEPLPPAAWSPAVAYRRAIARSTRPSDPPRAHVCPPACHRLESLEERRDGEGIIELGGDVGGGDVDEDGHVVERPVGHLTRRYGTRAIASSRRPRSKSRTALYS